jgi:hypothetical protein
VSTHQTDVPHHVADHRRGAAGADLDQVVPVAADLRSGDTGLVRSVRSAP